MELGVYSLVTPDYRIREAAELVAEVGFTGIEWTLDYPNALWDGESNWHLDSGNLEESAAAAREAAEANGLTAVAIGARCGCFDPDQVAVAMRAAQLAGAKGVRVHAPGYDGSEPYEELFERARQAYAALEPKARETGVKVWAEIHHGRIIPSASAARRLLDGLDPDWIGVIYDPGNMINEGMENWRMGVDMLGPYLQHVHVKDCGWFRGEDGWQTRNMTLDEGMADWEGIIGALKDAGYEGFLHLEDFRSGYASVSDDLPTRQLLEEDYDYLTALL
ncbi:MAG: sugar phosphate isomerase/epimerase family protein [Candidatus Brocadiia bacterium]